MISCGVTSYTFCVRSAEALVRHREIAQRLVSGALSTLYARSPPGGGSRAGGPVGLGGPWPSAYSSKPKHNHHITLHFDPSHVKVYSNGPHAGFEVRFSCPYCPIFMSLFTQFSCPYSLNFHVLIV